jgi:asparagine synthase (glutamine-hydrolysing)
MCGIFTILNNCSRFTEPFINQQFYKGRCRGPDNNKLRKELLNFILGFHRLSINGLDEASNQPFEMDDILLICNGEIYNYNALYDVMNITPKTNSDCEVIIHLYKDFGIEQTLRMLDGVFAFILVDLRITIEQPLLYVARDPFGVRPLYVLDNNDKSGSFTAFASEAKCLTGFHQDLNKNILTDSQQRGINNIFAKTNKHNLKHYPPGHYSCYKLSTNVLSSWKLHNTTRYHTTGFHNILDKSNLKFDRFDDILHNIRSHFKNAVYKRCANSDRPVGCLLSGGLDSSLVCALANQYCRVNNLPPIQTFSIGVKGSKDLLMAKSVADFLGTRHTEVVIQEEDFTSNIETVIAAIESYDTTTVRASLGNYLVGKYIKENTDIIVVLNGDGSDELCGGYLYMHKAPSDMDFDNESHNLLDEIYAFDVLRSDKCISSHGLEPRTPFLDRQWVQYYLSIPICIRNHTNNKNMEKYLLRRAFAKEDLLPQDVLWRSKEAFSDGVSMQERSLFEILQEYISTVDFKYKATTHNFMPETLEQKYYKHLFDKHYPDCEGFIPRYWMPKFVEARDSSARTLDLYNEISNDHSNNDYSLQLSA